MCGACLKPLLALMENQKQMQSFHYRVVESMMDRNETSQLMVIMQVGNYAMHLQKGSQKDYK